MTMRAPARGLCAPAAPSGCNSPARSIRFTIDGTPIPKARPRMTRSGTVYTTQRTREYEARGREIAALAMRGTDPIDGPIELWVSITVGMSAKIGRKQRERKIGMPVTSRPDLDNYVKSAMDIGNGIVFRDDAQVYRIGASKLYGDKPGMVVSVRSAEL